MRTVPLQHICDIQIGKTPSRLVPEYWGGELPWVTISDFASGRTIDTTKERITEIGAEKSGSKLIPQGTVLLSFKLSLGKRAYAGYDLFTNEAIAALQVLDQEVADRGYLYWVLGSIDYDRLVDRAAKGKTLNKAKLKILPIPLPPLPEQKRIAGILDAADALRAKRRESLTQLDTLLKSTFLDMFGDPVTNPRGWDVRALGDVCLGKPAYGSGAAACDFDPTLPRYVRITDVNDSGGLSSDPKSAKLSAKEIEKYRLHEGDVLLARSGATVGKSYLHHVCNAFCVYAGYMIRFRPDPEKLLPETLFHYTKTPAYWRWINSQARAVAQPNINATMYSGMPLIVAPLDLQRRFADIVESVERQKARLRAHLAELDKLFSSLQSRAFNGEL